MGTKLSSEATLAEQMRISCPSVREGLIALAAVGLIESKPGSGNYVRKGTPPVDTIGREAVLMLENESNCVEIMEYILGQKMNLHDRWQIKLISCEWRWAA